MSTCNTLNNGISYAMFNRDGLFMAYVDEKKGQWYLRKQLADEIEPHVIRLKFYPKGNGRNGIPFFETKKEFRCVCCGSEENLTKHHCVPSWIRIFMQPKYKRSHYDVLYLCLGCHHEYESIAYIFKKDLFLKNGIDTRTNEYNHSVKWISSLLQHKDKMPNDRIKYLLDKISSVFDREVNIDELQDLLVIAKNNSSEIDLRKINRKLFDQFPDEEELILLFRHHFLETMKPKFLPEHWDADYIDTIEDILQ